VYPISAPLKAQGPIVTEHVCARDAIHVQLLRSLHLTERGKLDDAVAAIEAVQQVNHAKVLEQLGKKPKTADLK